MTILMNIGIPLAAALVAVIALLIIIKGCWKVAGTNEVIIVSGLGKVKKKTGGGIFVLPVVQKVQRMTLENIQVDFTSRNEIPTKDAIHVLVDAVANMAISTDPARQAIAASKFAGYSIQQIRDTVIPVLEGNIREIISQTAFEDLIRGDKKVFAERIQENVTPNLADLGIDLTTFNIQNFSDKNGVIRDLGVDNIEKVRKEAQIAAARAKAEVAIAAAQAEKEANDAKVAADTEIEQRNTELAIRKAELKKQSDIEWAKTEAAKEIEAEAQRKTREIAEADANLARQEKAIILQEREVEITKRKLEAEIEKKAEAEKKAAQARADARLYETQKAAEAELFQRQKKAEAQALEEQKRAEMERFSVEQEAAAKTAMAAAIEAEGKAKAEAARAQGEAEARAIEAKLLAEAKGLEEKALAMEKYGEAAKKEQEYEVLKAYFAQMPEIAKAVGEGYKGVDKIVMMGSDSNQLAGNIINTTTQISEGLSAGLGIDLKSLMSGILGAKLLGGNGVTVNVEDVNE